ncbi:hypothetical protein GF352_00145 [archaeon]|nr:hypothetical protein [archaeon]
MRARRGRGRGRGPPSKCVCPNPDCDYEEEHVLGRRCLSRTCPECGTRLIGKW